MEKEFICTYHEYIKERSRKIKKFDMSKITTLEEAIAIINQMKQQATEIYDYAKLAKRAGIRMENRMKVVRAAIESAGFERKKRKKYERK